MERRRIRISAVAAITAGSFLAASLLTGLNTASAVDPGKGSGVNKSKGNTKTKLTTIDRVKLRETWTQDGYDSDQVLKRLIADVKADGKSRDIIAFRDGKEEPQYYGLYKTFGRRLEMKDLGGSGDRYVISDDGNSFEMFDGGGTDKIPFSSLSDVHARIDPNHIPWPNP